LIQLARFYIKLILIFDVVFLLLINFTCQQFSQDDIVT
jgi:hypothetical protein